MVSITLAIIGTDEEPRWAADVRYGRENAPRGDYCCAAGHYTPEQAAAHGCERGTALLARAARAQSVPGTAGGMAIEKLEPAA